MGGAPLLRKQRTQGCEHHRFELLKLDGLRSDDQIDGQQVALLLKVHRAGNHIHQYMEDLQQLFHPAFSLLAHDFIAEGAHSTETEGLRAFTFDALFFYHIIPFFPCFLLRLFRGELFLFLRRGLHNGPIFLDDPKALAIGVPHKPVAGAAIA